MSVSPDSSSMRSAQKGIWQQWAEKLKRNPTPENYAHAYVEVCQFLQKHGDPAKARHPDGTIFGPSGDVHDWEKEIIILLAGERGKRVLEVGCGDGRMTLEIVSRGAVVKGIDISSVAIQYARKIAVNQDLPAQFEVANAVVLAEDTDSYDYVVSSDMVEHLNPEHVPTHLREVRRVLKPGGAYIISLPSWVPEDKVDPLHLGNYHAKEFSTMLRHARFIVKPAALVLFERTNDWTPVVGLPRTFKAKLGRAVARLPKFGPIFVRKLINRRCRRMNFYYAAKPILS